MPYINDRFVQSNQRFILNPSSLCKHILIDDVDQLIQWDCINKIIFIQNEKEINCPICLNAPICPKSTKCGHVFCWSCMLQYFSYQKSIESGLCPVCQTLINVQDLKSVFYQKVIEYPTAINFQLLFRPRNLSIIYVMDKEELPNSTSHSFIYNRICYFQDIEKFIEDEKRELEKSISEAISEQSDTVPFLLEANEIFNVLVYLSFIISIRIILHL